MIRLASLARAAPAIWLAIPICLLAGFYVTLLPPSDRYAVDATAKATAVLPFVGAFAAACAAWEAGRLRRARIWGGPWARSRLEIAAWCIVPAVLVGIVAVGIAVGHQLLRSDALGGPDWAIVALAALNLVAYATAGFALGLALPFAIAGPTAIVGAIIWLAFVPAMDPVWLRHLTGMFRDCCSVSEELAIRPLAASALIDVAVISVALLAITAAVRRAMLRRAVSSVVLVAALVGGALLVRDMDYAPVVSRDAATMQCDDTADVTVCIWPEHAVRAADIRSTTNEVVARWASVGIAAPQAITEAARDVAAPDSATLRIRADASDDDIIAALSAAILPPTPDCFGGFTGGPAFQYLEAWYAYVGGMSQEAWRAQYEIEMEPLPAVPALIADMAEATPAAREQWIDRAEEVSQACDEWEPSLLAVNQ